MSTSPQVDQDLRMASSVPSTLLRALWKCVRLPLLGILMLVEPIMKYMLGSAMVLGIFASIAFEISAAGPRFPFLMMIALSLSFGVALFLYYGLISLLSD